MVSCPIGRLLKGDFSYCSDFRVAQEAAYPLECSDPLFNWVEMTVVESLSLVKLSVQSVIRCSELFLLCRVCSAAVPAGFFLVRVWCLDLKTPQ